MPVNEVYRDSSLTAFVCQLQYTVFTKNTDQLLSVVDGNVKNSFGGEGGIDEFQEMWRTDDPDSPLWLCLSKLISLGGTFSAHQREAVDPDSFVFPYVYSAELPESVDVFAAMVVTAERVNVRQRPDRTAPVVGHLSHEVVTSDYSRSYPEGDRLEQPQKEWYYVSSLDGKTSGYVWWDDVWSPVGYRMFLDKTGGEWKITALVTGD